LKPTRNSSGHEKNQLYEARQGRAVRGKKSQENNNPTSTASASIGAGQIGIERLQVSTTIVIATTEPKTIRATLAMPGGQKEKVSAP